MQPDIEAFFHESTSAFSYVVSDPESGECAVIDPVLDFDPKSGRTSTEPADRITTFITDKGLDAKWILETHVQHAGSTSTRGAGEHARRALPTPRGQRHLLLEAATQRAVAESLAIEECPHCLSS